MMFSNDVTIVVTTCVKFSDLWKNNLLLLNRFWPNHPKVIFVSDGEDHDLDFDVLSYPGLDYSFRLKKALKTVDTPYVFLTLDDYLVNAPVDEKKLQDLLNYMQTKGLDYCRLFRRTAVKEWIDKRRKLKQIAFEKKCYEVNLYPGIWKTESLFSLIRGDENIWKFEVRMTRRAKENGFRCIACYDQRIFPFVDTIRKGKYLRKAYRFLKRNGLYISDRPIRPIIDDVKLSIQTFVSRHLPIKWKSRIKAMSGKTYYSDYAETED